MSGHASAPASSANLGPGFDALALALDLRCRVEAKESTGWTIAQDGTSYSPDPDDFVREAVASAVDGAFHVSIENAVPRGRGLGSSAAVATAAIAASIRASGKEPESRSLFELSASIDGHPDNAAAAVYGGLVVIGSGGVARHLDVHPDLRVIVGIPAHQLSTRDARFALSPEVGRGAVARSLARIVFLIEGLRTGEAAAFAGAAGDELHEEPRGPLSPVSGRLMEAARDAGALHAAWSGAGPSVIAFAVDPTSAAVEAAMESVLDGVGDVAQLEIDTAGWR